MTENIVNGIEPFHAMEILAAAKQLEEAGRSVIHLEVGEPSAAAAPSVLAAAGEALAMPQKYTHAMGIMALRQRISAYYAQTHNCQVSPENIIVTTGSSAGFLLAFLAGFAPGSAIAVTRPGYPAYVNILNALGFRPVEIAVQAQNGWRLSADDIAKAHAETPFAGLLFASPANPTGAVLNSDQLSDILEVSQKLGVRVISDEIYHGLSYQASSRSALEFGDRAIVINSFSKFYCMTGWRIGWMVLPDALVRQVEVLQQNMFISPPSLSQVAALAALDAPEHSRAQKEIYTQNRAVLAAGLEKLGFGGPLMSQGAFYIYADARRFTNDSLAFCKHMLNAIGVAATPGVDFDRVDGHKYVRFSFAGAPDDMHEALKRMAGYLTQPS